MALQRTENVNKQKYLCSDFFYGSTVLDSPRQLIVEVSKSHSDTPHWAGLFWTSDRPVPETSTSVFLNRRAAARYRALATIILDRERPEETTVCYKISLVQLITNLNVILYLLTCHTVYISVQIFFMIMP